MSLLNCDLYKKKLYILGQVNIDNIILVATLNPNIELYLPLNKKKYDGLQRTPVKRRENRRKGRERELYAKGNKPIKRKIVVLILDILICFILFI